MDINESLNLVVPVTDTINAYHTPISREVYQANFRILGQAKAAIYAQGLPYAAGVGPLQAALTLREEGELLAQARGKEGDSGAGAFLKEIDRLTTILVPGSSGYDMVPVDAALAEGFITTSDYDEVESAIVFFTFELWVNRNRNKASLATLAASIVGGSITSSSITEYSASLRTSTKAATTRKAASSVPV